VPVTRGVPRVVALGADDVGCEPCEEDAICLLEHSPRSRVVGLDVGALLRAAEQPLANKSSDIVLANTRQCATLLVQVDDARHTVFAPVDEILRHRRLQFFEEVVERYAVDVHGGCWLPCTVQMILDDVSADALRRTNARRSGRPHTVFSNPTALAVASTLPDESARRRGRRAPVAHEVPTGWAVGYLTVPAP
jgi:hypothetical protein